MTCLNLLLRTISQLRVGHRIATKEQPLDWTRGKALAEAVNEAAQGLGDLGALGALEPSLVRSHALALRGALKFAFEGPSGFAPLNAQFQATRELLEELEARAWA